MTREEAILKTLAYHDIFDYPLTLEEIHKFLIGKKASLESIESEILNLLNAKKIVEYSSKEVRSLNSSRLRSNNIELYSLQNRQKLFSLRKQRAKYSESKLKRAQLFSFLLSLIPNVKMVGISGALAMDNSKKSDDIDLMVICAKNTLWTTRLLANLLLLPFKRDPQGKKIADRACLNLYLDESELKISPQNLYIAHEICQMRPIFDRNKTYSQFIKSNHWIFKFLPNWQPQEVVNSKWKMVNRKASPKKINSLFTINNLPIEKIFKSFQLWYMRSKISTERIGNTQLFFHPRDTEKSIMAEYKKRLNRLKIVNS